MDMSSLVILEKSFESVFFDETRHLYTIDGESARSSVTQFLKQYETPFKEDQVSKIVAAKQGVLVEDVKHLWAFKREYACEKGTILHAYIEDVLHRKRKTLNRTQIEDFVKKYPEYISVDQYYLDMARYVKNFYNFYDWWKQDHILVKSELVIGDKKTKISGCIDNVSLNHKNGKLIIFDYKSNKKIETSGKEKMLKELKHLDACELVKYSLQLHLYKAIIERNTPFEVSDLYIVWLSGTDYELIPTLNVEEEVKVLLEKINLE